MEESIGLLVEFFKANGLALTIIAIVGIVVLGVLKYCNLFKKIDESKRHYIYLGISVGFSIIATIIYLACIHQLTFTYVYTVATAIYALNQTFYAVFKITPINKIASQLLTMLLGFFKKKAPEVAEKAEEIIDKIDKGI